MDQHYSAVVDWSAEDEEFIAMCPEFPGASGSGESKEEAILELRESISVLLETYATKGIAAPEPRLHEEFSGQVRLRLPKELHRDLVIAAEKQGVSLNTLFVSYLAQGLGRASEERELHATIKSMMAMLGQQTLVRGTSAPSITSDATSMEMAFVAPLGYGTTWSGNH